MLIDLNKIRSGHTITGPVTTNRIREGKRIAELRDYDDENHRIILLECKEHVYETLNEAVYAISQFMRSAFKKLGVRAIEDFHAAGPAKEKIPELDKRLVAEMKEKEIHLETRDHRGLDLKTEGWKTGKYIYYKGDIVYFISNPHSKRKFRSGIVIVGQVDYCLRTNAPSFV